MRLASLVLMLMGATFLTTAGFMVHAMVQASFADVALRNSVDDALRNAFLVFTSGIIAFVLGSANVIMDKMDELRKRVKVLEEKLAPPSSKS